MSYTQIDQPTTDGTLRYTERGDWFAPGRVISMLLGAALTLLGAVVLARTGIDSDLAEPQTTVFGIVQSAIIGLAWLVAGVLLIASSLSESARGLGAFVGVVALLGGIVGLAASAEIRQDVGFESSTAWLAVFVGVVALVASVLPSVWSVKRDVERR
jgi:hypothetical protein